VAVDGVGFVAEPPEVAADGSSAATIRLEVRDACGNPAFGRTVSLAAFGDAPAALSATETTTGDDWGGPLDGAALVEARSPEPGTMGLEATMEDAVFRSAPDLVTFRPAAPADDDEDGSGDDADAGERDGDDASAGDAGPRSGGGGCGCTVPDGQGPPIGFLLFGLALAVRRRSIRRPGPGRQHGR
jgi:MYXO-CTERM domain-containing protein